MEFAWGVLAVLVVIAAFPKTFGWAQARLLKLTDDVTRNATPMRVMFWIAALVAVVASRKFSRRIWRGSLPWTWRRTWKPAPLSRSRVRWCGWTWCAARRPWRLYAACAS